MIDNCIRKILMATTMKAAAVKVHANTDAALRRLASAVVLGVAVALIVVKFWGWTATGSVALLTSAADAVVDALAAMATFFGVRFAQHPADSEHRFGHGKGEALAAFTQAVLLASAAVVLAAQSLWRLVYPQPLAAVTLGLWIAAGGLAISSLLAALPRWGRGRTGSARHHSLPPPSRPRAAGRAARTHRGGGSRLFRRAANSRSPYTGRGRSSLRRV